MWFNYTLNNGKNGLDFWDNVINLFAAFASPGLSVVLMLGSWVIQAGNAGAKQRWGLGE